MQDIKLNFLKVSLLCVSYLLHRNFKAGVFLRGKTLCPNTQLHSYPTHNISTDFRLPLTYKEIRTRGTNKYQLVS